MDRDRMQVPQEASLNPDSNADRPQNVGVGTVLDAVQGCTFPVSRQELIAARGDKDIELRGGSREKLRVVLLRSEADEFLSVTDLVQKLERVV
ncbi:hypothetical protein D3C86_704100 [compost metagenome]